MISEYYSKISKALLVIAILVIMLLPDVVFELLFEFFHIVWELIVEFADIVFEGVESGLDHVVESLFETDLHDTQIIVFYIILAVVLYVFYRLSLFIPGIYRRLKKRILTGLEMRKIRTIIYWQGLPLIEKAKFAAIGTLIVLYYVFFAF
ncbi:hypothetical protein JCM14076_24180 [Methylosoma difficile]